MRAEPGALAFANTRSSSGRDRIATLPQWRRWVDGWPGLRSSGHRITTTGLAAIRDLRDEIQSLFHGAAAGERPDPAVAERVARLATSTPSFEIRWRAGLPVVTVGNSTDASAVVVHYLARAAVDTLAAGLQLRLCDGARCRKVFVASRSDRRWCDSAVCGNRSRVRAHRRKRREPTPMPGRPKT